MLQFTKCETAELTYQVHKQGKHLGFIVFPFPVGEEPIFDPRGEEAITVADMKQMVVFIESIHEQTL